MLLQNTFAENLAGNSYAREIHFAKLFPIFFHLCDFIFQFSTIIIQAILEIYPAYDGFFVSAQLITGLAGLQRCIELTCTVRPEIIHPSPMRNRILQEIIIFEVTTSQMLTFQEVFISMVSDVLQGSAGFLLPRK